MEGKHKKFLDEVEAKAKSEGIDFLAFSFEGGDVNYAGHCKKSEIGAVLFLFINEYPELYRALESYIQTGEIPDSL